MVQIYKKGQGKYTRMTTLLTAVSLAAIAAVSMSEFLTSYSVTQTPLIRYGVPLLLVACVGLLVLWIVNRPRTADFLIATEGEMKKVSWSSKKEIIGSTKVVIITTLIMAMILFIVDLSFRLLFLKAGIT